MDIEIKILEQDNKIKKLLECEKKKSRKEDPVRI